MDLGDFIPTGPPRYSDGVGVIQHNNATVTIFFEHFGIGTSYILREQSVSNYPSEPGDSGSPVFINNGDGTGKMLGMVVAMSCEIIIDEIPVNDQNEYNNCYRNYKIFSPWENIKQSLGIE